VPVVGVLRVPVVSVPVVVGVDVQDSDTETAVPVTGRLIADSGVPGGTSMLKESVWPPASVTDTVQLSA
jgi:hypothetical protein